MITRFQNQNGLYPLKYFYNLNMNLPIPEKTIESLLSDAYVHAVTSRAGLAYVELNQKIDYMKIDSEIIGRYERGNGTVNSIPKVWLQHKSSFNSRFIGDNIHFNLDVPTFNVLSSKDHDLILLLVLILPENRDQWLSHTVDYLISRKCAYWCSLIDYPERPDPGQGDFTIKIPIQNVFSPTQITQIMERLSRREVITYGRL